MKGGAPEADNYETLAQFYMAIENALKEFSQKKDIQFGNDGHQFLPGLGYAPRVKDTGGIVIVNDLDSALLALRTIIAQGSMKFTCLF